MSNYCNFGCFLIGSKKDITRFNSVMAAGYSYGLRKDFVKSLGLYSDDDPLINEEDSFIRLEAVRRKAMDEKNQEAIEKLKDENLKREYFENIPEDGHLFGILKYSIDPNMEKLDENLYISRNRGVCKWSVETSLMDIAGNGYYSDNKGIFPENIYAGTTLVEFVKKVPNLKVAIISTLKSKLFPEMPGLDELMTTDEELNFSEFYALSDGKLVSDECEYITFDSGKLISPEWFIVGEDESLVWDENYILDKLHFEKER